MYKLKGETGCIVVTGTELIHGSAFDTYLVPRARLVEKIHGAAQKLPSEGVHGGEEEGKAYHETRCFVIASDISISFFVGKNRWSGWAVIFRSRLSRNVVSLEGNLRAICFVISWESGIF